MNAPTLAQGRALYLAAESHALAVDARSDDDLMDTQNVYAAAIGQAIYDDAEFWEPLGAMFGR